MDAVISVGKKFIFKNVADRIFLKEIKKILVFFFSLKQSMYFMYENYGFQIYLSVNSIYYR